MAQIVTKQNVPIFVSSTFTDMQLYRRKVRDALTQLETIVRGMEQFGSKPDSPVTECINIVKSCQMYIGVFGMRYGSIPEGYDKSMTHLEYIEAQKVGLPSLIYILDENQPIPAKDVETGVGAERLRGLKEQLMKQHVVSFFTTAEDLQARIMHDIPEQLKRTGVQFSGDLNAIENATDEETLKNFDKLPRIFSGRQITVEFKIGTVRPAFDEECGALKLEHGATVTSPVNMIGGKSFAIYAEREMAVKLLSIPEGSTVVAKINTSFGVASSIMFSNEDDLIVDKRGEKGLIITHIISEKSEIK